MIKRKKIIVANWKMNKDAEEAQLYARELNKKITNTSKTTVIIAAPFIDLPFLKKLKCPKIKLAAQNLYPGEKGPYTGEISGSMLKPFIDYVILGHSERRGLFGDNDETVKAKIKSALFFKIKPIVCFGETPEEKANGQSRQVIEKQLAVCLEGLTDEEIGRCVLVYEPVWAISSTQGATGEGDNPENAQVMHKLIRHNVAKRFSPELAEAVPIIYGGSVNPANAAALFQMPDIDGGLVGKASLQIDSFFEIIRIASL